jgi:dipeptide transport system substrate-binding protein
VAQAKTVTDIKERAALYEKALSILQDEVPIIPIAHSTLYRVVHKDVKGFEISALGRDQFDGVNL